MALMALDDENAVALVAQAIRRIQFRGLLATIVRDLYVIGPVVGDGFGPIHMINLTVEVPDRVTGTPLCVKFQSPITGVGSDADALDLVWQAVNEALAHEAAEGIVLADGTRPFDPHEPSGRQMAETARISSYQRGRLDERRLAAGRH